MHRAIILTAASALLFVGLLLAGCQSPQALPAAPTAIPTLIPATMPALPAVALAPGAPPAAVPAAAPGAAAAGEQIFSTTCAICHRLTNEILVGPGLAPLYAPDNVLPNGQPPTDENVIAWIHTGGNGMPGFPQIQGDQLGSLLAFLHGALSGPGAAPAAGAPITTTTATTATVAAPGALVTGTVAETATTTMPMTATMPEEGATATSAAPITATAEVTAAMPATTSGVTTETTTTDAGAVPPTVVGQAGPPPAAAPATVESAPAVATPAGPGADLWNAECAICHALTGEVLVGQGMAGLFGPDKQLPDGKPVTDENLIAYLQTGSDGMPGYAQIQGEQMQALISFLKEATASQP